ncbi:MAG TPA: T9SS type A sorting domain-containing protein [Chitinophagaceae bacterium]|jgi:hypothetical protein|nr:T9SS type A sorting domain-containing protein [Chitinophagaceae bacterium]
MKRTLFLFVLFAKTITGISQNFPWQNALVMVRSSDGINFNSPSIFQDSSGVPCIIHWKGDTLVAVFQWFRQPNPSPSWDRVAVKFSYDNGTNWTPPTPIVVNNMPVNYQRPFDPTIVVTPDKNIRIFFSSSAGIPIGGLDHTVNTYSAISADGINYTFEPGARFDHPTIKVIDPALTIFNGSWQYTAPIGAPNDGAFHCTSPDGLVFTQLGNLPSDNNHNWTGNMLVDGGLLRFYGSGPTIWRNTSADGVSWSGYVNTNIVGGDPGIVKLPNGTYLMVYVGPPNIITATIGPATASTIQVFPNPFHSLVNIKGKTGKRYPYTLYSANGQLISEGNFTGDIRINTSGLPAGAYLLATEENKKIWCTKLVKQ